MDWWDCLGLASALSVIGGIGALSVPAALICAGLAGLGLYYLRERNAAQSAPDSGPSPSGDATPTSGDS